MHFFSLRCVLYRLRNNCELPEKVTLNAVNSAKILGLSEKNSCKIERNSHSNYLAQYPNKSSVYQHF